MPSFSNLCTYSRRDLLLLLVTNTRRLPDSRSSAMDSRTPGRRVSPCQTTPSQSMTMQSTSEAMRDHKPSSSFTSRSSADPAAARTAREGRARETATVRAGRRILTTPPISARCRRGGTTPRERRRRTRRRGRRLTCWFGRKGRRERARRSGASSAGRRAAAAAVFAGGGHGSRTHIRPTTSTSIASHRSSAVLVACSDAAHVTTGGNSSTPDRSV